MRQRLLNAPYWVHVLVSGVPFGLAMGIYTAFRGWPAAWAYGVGGGILFGLTFGWYAHRMARQTRDALAGVPDADRPAVLKALRAGSPPSDPEMRRAVVDLTRKQRDDARRRRPWLVTVNTALLVLELFLALTSSAWYWLAVAFFAAMLLLATLLPALAERQLRRLESPEPS